VIIRVSSYTIPYIYRSIPFLFHYSFYTIYYRLLLTLYIRPAYPDSLPFCFITDANAYTPEGGLEAFATALHYRYSGDIPYKGKAEHTPSTKDKAGRRDG